jgi:hypothetical protein
MASKSRTVSLELTTSNQDIYTVPNNYEAEIKSIYIANHSASELTFSLDWYDSVNTTYYTMAENTKLLSNGLVQITESLWLQKNDKLRGLCSSSNNVTVTIQVEENYLPQRI